VPIAAGHETNPDFTAPIRDGFVGTFEPVPKRSKPVAIEHSWEKTKKGFETSGVLLLNDGALKQKLRITTAGKQTVVYQDHVTAVRDATINEEYGIPLGIENDQITGGTRVVYHQGGSKTFTQSDPQIPTIIPGSWANVDSRLGVVVLSGSGI